MELFYDNQFVMKSDNVQEIFARINADKKPYYTRAWMEEDTTVVIDYGSWSSFAFIKGAELTNDGEIVPII